MKSRFWADHGTREIAAMDRDRLVAVLPVGAIEQHGPHLPLSVDTAILNGIIAATVPLLPDDLPVLFLPTLPVGKSDEHGAYPGTLTLSAATLIALWTDIGESVARAGVRRIVLLNSHGGQMAPTDIVVRDLRLRHRMIAVAASWFAMGLPAGLFDEGEERFGIHAGDMETSVMRALHPDLVAMEHARDFRSTSQDRAERYAILGNGKSAKMGWAIEDYHPSGAVGEADAATADKGRAVVHAAGAALAALLAEVAALPLETVRVAGV